MFIAIRHSKKKDDWPVYMYYEFLEKAMDIDGINHNYVVALDHFDGLV